MVVNDWSAAGAMLLLAAVVVCSGYAAHQATAVEPSPLLVGPFLSGGIAREHAVSRYHARWYAVTLLFLAFDVEMLFMYPWAVVAAEIGASAIVEMSVFLGLLAFGVLYAWREGALEWA
jgi:NADH:ubiquinone oxidoreductase subunit 3 (subunit A)